MTHGVDLVRYTVIVNNLENVKDSDFLQILYSMFVVGLDNSFGGERFPPKGEGKDLRRRMGKKIGLRDQFRITTLENRFDVSYNDEKSMGYRDLTSNVEVS